MGKISGCLKDVFIAFNSLFAVLGILTVLILLGFGSKYQMVEMDGQTIIWAWVFAIAIIGITTLGSHAARIENKCGLKAFAVFMGIGMVIMLIFGVCAIVYKTQVKQSSENAQMINNEALANNLELFFNISIGICFGFSFTAMMGLIIAGKMTDQISRHDSDGVPAFAMKAI